MTDVLELLSLRRAAAPLSAADLAQRLYEQFDALAQAAARQAVDEQAASLAVSTAAILLAASYFEGDDTGAFVALAADTFDDLHPPAERPS